MIKLIRAAVALAGLSLIGKVHAISTNDIQLWTGSGTNRAAVVIEWNSPEAFNNSMVPAPIANKTMVWGYQFNGTSTGTQMFDAILASDPRLYAVIDNTYGTFVEGIGYNLNANGISGVTDGSSTYGAAAFVNGALINPNLDVDAAYPLNTGDLFWSGYFGPNWGVWTELGDTGGFAASPDRGTNQFWNPTTYTHGQWESANFGLDDLPVYDGSWIGFSVAAAGYDTNNADAATAAFNFDEQAPPSPDGTYVAYVCNTNDFAIQVISSSGLDPRAPYNDPTAVLGRPALKFVDIYDGGGTNRTSIIDPPYNVAPDGGNLLAEITAGGQITVMMGRKVYHNPNNPYGVDLVVYGNSFYSASGISGTISDSTDLGVALLGSGAYGHSATVSVSPDGTNWFTFPNTSMLFPDNAFRWDDANQSWTDEQLNPNKPLNPSVYATDYAGQTVASGLDQFLGASGGTGYNLQQSGFPWIQYVNIQPASNNYTVIDAIAAVNPVMEGDALAVTPDNITAGITNVTFQNPSNTSETVVSVGFAALTEAAKVGTVALSDFSSFAPVPGTVSSACQITVAPLSGTVPVHFVANVTLSAGDGYNGNGSDLRVLQWNGVSWATQPFTFNASNNQVTVTGLTSLSAFVVSRLAPRLSTLIPRLTFPGSPRFLIQFTVFANLTYTLQRSTDLLTWTSIGTITSPSVETIDTSDNAPPATHAFYRLVVAP